jgi:hypothetical protein
LRFDYAVDLQDGTVGSDGNLDECDEDGQQQTDGQRCTVLEDHDIPSDMDQQAASPSLSPLTSPRRQAVPGTACSRGGGPHGMSAARTDGAYPSQMSSLALPVREDTHKDPMQEDAFSGGNPVSLPGNGHLGFHIYCQKTDAVCFEIFDYAVDLQDGPAGIDYNSDAELNECFEDAPP